MIAPEREPSYRPILLVSDANMAQVSAVLARRLELPAVLVEQVPTRRYPDNAMAAHLFGYVGEITDVQLPRSENPGRRSGDVVGQAGVELTYNRLLMGEDGARRVVVNSAGREIQTIGELKPVEGQRLQLTIDYELQRAAEQAFKALGFWGAAVILDPRTGEILALVSLPAYDPNTFASGVDRATWSALNTDALRPLQYRAMQGCYSPGSTLTPAGYGVVSLAGVIHWWTLPSLIQTVLLPWRWTAARFWVYLLPAVPGRAGPNPEPATVASTGIIRSPSAPVGSWFKN